MNAVQDRRGGRRQRAPGATANRSASTERSHLRVVPEPRTRAPAGRVPFLVSAFLLVTGLVVAVVSLQALVSQTSFRMEDLRRGNDQLQVRFDELRVEVASLSSPARIRGAATTAGLVFPDEANVKAIRVGFRSPGDRGIEPDGWIALHRLLGSAP